MKPAIIEISTRWKDRQLARKMIRSHPAWDHYRPLICMQVGKSDLNAFSTTELCETYNALTEALRPPMRGAPAQTGAAPLPALPAPLEKDETMTNNSHQRHRQPLTVPQQADIFRMLEANYDQDAGRYKPDWNDEKIAKELGLQAGHISYRRVQMYGPIRPTPSAAADMLRRLVDLEERVFSLETQLGIRRG